MKIQTMKPKTKIKVAIIATLLLTLSILSIAIARSTIDINAYAYDAGTSTEYQSYTCSESINNGQALDLTFLGDCAVYVNMVAFSNFIQGLGYDLECQQDVAVFSENILEYYYQATAYGLVMPLDTLSESTQQGYSEQNNFQPMWIPEGPGSNEGKMVYNNRGTHQMMAGKAFDYALNRFPTLFGGGNFTCSFNSSSTGNSRRALFMRWSDWPDMWESGQRYPGIDIGILDGWANNSHFYHPYTGENFFRDFTWNGPGTFNFLPHNARERVEYFFNKAVAIYPSPRAFEFLGAASHFMSDLASPVHTGDRLPAYLVPALALSVLNPIPFIVALTASADVIWQGANHSAFEDVTQTYINNSQGRLYAWLNNGTVNSNRVVSTISAHNGNWFSSPAFASMAPGYIAHWLARYSYSRYSIIGNWGHNPSDNTRRDEAYHMV